MRGKYSAFAPRSARWPPEPALRGGCPVVPRHCEGGGRYCRRACSAPDAVRAGTSPGTCPSRGSARFPPADLAPMWHLTCRRSEQRSACARETAASSCAPFSVSRRRFATSRVRLAISSSRSRAAARDSFADVGDQRRGRRAGLLRREVLGRGLTEAAQPSPNPFPSELSPLPFAQSVSTPPNPAICLAESTLAIIRRHAGRWELIGPCDPYAARLQNTSAAIRSSKFFSSGLHELVSVCHEAQHCRSARRVSSQTRRRYWMASQSPGACVSSHVQDSPCARGQDNETA